MGIEDLCTNALCDSYDAGGHIGDSNGRLYQSNSKDNKPKQKVYNKNENIADS